VVLGCAISGCHPTVARLHDEARLLIPSQARIVEATDDHCRENLGLNPTCRRLRWQERVNKVRRPAAFVERARANRWSLHRSTTSGDQHWFIVAKHNWRAVATIFSERAYRPVQPCPPDRPDGAVTPCADVLDVMWTGPTLKHDLGVALILAFSGATLVGLAIRRRQALWIVAVVPLGYLALLVASPGYRLEAPLVQLVVTTAVAAAACQLGISLGNRLRPKVTATT
jgi:hypothetical protein